MAWPWISLAPSLRLALAHQRDDAAPLTDVLHPPAPGESPERDPGENASQLSGPFRVRGGCDAPQYEQPPHFVSRVGLSFWRPETAW